MKKIVLSLVVLAVLATALFTVGSAYAQAPVPQTPTAPAQGAGVGPGRMARGQRGPAIANGGEEGPLHEAMLQVYASNLGLTVDALVARLANGETLSAIAAEKGLPVEQFQALMVEARGVAADQAVKDGTLTQEQADWLKTRGAGQGGRMVGRGARGQDGMGMYAGDCPYITQ